MKETGTTAARSSVLKTKKDTMLRDERTFARVFRIEKRIEGGFSRGAVIPETRRRKSAEPEA